ncbi:hypothetical protein VNO77_27714 [Canavalia gladiata]|uniref:Uncharacterized protein n=1 Tax=Canavalia gladiata TaxID=3824 RepID=A0AAN9KZD1_CANGL
MEVMQMNLDGYVKVKRTAAGSPQPEYFLHEFGVLLPYVTLLYCDIVPSCLMHLCNTLLTHHAVKASRLSSLIGNPSSVVRVFSHCLLTLVINQYVPNLDEGKAFHFLFIEVETKVPT